MFMGTGIFNHAHHQSSKLDADVVWREVECAAGHCKNLKPVRMIPRMDES